jgi:NAD(P)-dependent dehydrogenase (short-subunit alcohol dehydrogenase family)
MNNLSQFDLSGQVAVITGGCGQLGSQYAKALLDAGAAVALLDIRVRIAPWLQDAETSGRLIAHTTDITNKENVQEAFNQVSKSLGTSSILINNGGIDVRPDAPVSENGPFEDYSEESWDAVIASHLKGAFLVSQEFIRRVRAENLSHASIINVSSTYGVVTPDQSIYEYRRQKGEVFFKPVAYSVAKSGMLNLTRWLAEYGGPYGIRANTLVPGGVFAKQDDEFVNEYSRRTMLGRMAEATEYNGAILFLASHPHSSYMTGATFVVDGGWTAR